MYRQALVVLLQSYCESTQRGISRIYLFGSKIGRILLIFKYSSSGFLKNTKYMFQLRPFIYNPSCSHCEITQLTLSLQKAIPNIFEEIAI